MPYTHKFEIDIEGEGVLEGQLDFSNPNDGIKFTDVSENLEMHIKCMQCILSMIIRMKEMSSTVVLNSFTIEKI